MWAVYREVNSLDPIFAFDYPENTTDSLLYESLLRQAADGSIGPGLATLTYPDPTTLVFTLKPGVAFWDGTPVTSDDVVVVRSARGSMRARQSTQDRSSAARPSQLQAMRQQAVRVSHRCAFFLAEQGTPGVIVEHGPTDAMFSDPQDPRTSDYVNGRFG